MMKVRLLKDLPFAKAGVIGIKTISGYKFGCHEFTEKEIVNAPDFFEVIEDEPVWAREEWRIISIGQSFEMESLNNGQWHIVSTSPRVRLIENAPDMWRMLKEVANSGGSMSWLSAELLKEIGK